jgi:YD repeat-containing protein
VLQIYWREPYNAAGMLETLQRYANVNGTTGRGLSTYTYDDAGRLTNLRSTDYSGAALANYTYTYDAAGRITTDVLDGTTKTYTYDNANQLTADGAATYTFDGTGNRNSGSYATSTGNRLSNDGVYTYTYDAEGSLTKKSKGRMALPEVLTFCGRGLSLFLPRPGEQRVVLRPPLPLARLHPVGPITHLVAADHDQQPGV